MDFEMDEHDTFLIQLKSTLNDLIKSEPLLSDLSGSIGKDEKIKAFRMKELKLKVAYENGNAIKLLIRRGDDQIIGLTLSF